MAESGVLTLEGINHHRPFGFFCDIDGTIAPIVPRPEEAAVSPRARELLRDLAGVADLVAVVTGRGLTAARGLVGLDQVTYVGNHGLEWWMDGRGVDAPHLAPYRERMAAIADVLEAALDPPGVLVERKGPVAAVHYRLADDPEAARAAVMRALDAVPSLEGIRVREGMKVVELFPDVDVSKGAAVRLLVESRGLASAAFVGDDWTDLDAFRALHDLRRRGRVRARTVAVRHAETPDAVLEAGDEIVDGVPGTEGFLERLKAALATPASGGR